MGVRGPVYTIMIHFLLLLLSTRPVTTTTGYYDFADTGRT